MRGGTTAETWVKKNLRDLATNADLVTVDSYKAGLDKVANGEIDAFFADRALLLGNVVRSETPGVFLISDKLFTYEPYALALQRGDEDFRLLIDRVLSTLYRSGAVSRVMTKHLGRPGAAQLTIFQMFSLPE